MIMTRSLRKWNDVLSTTTRTTLPLQRWGPLKLEMRGASALLQTLNREVAFKCGVTRALIILAACVLMYCLVWFVFRNGFLNNF